MGGVPFSSGAALGHGWGAKKTVVGRWGETEESVPARMGLEGPVPAPSSSPQQPQVFRNADISVFLL